MGKIKVRGKEPIMPFSFILEKYTWLFLKKKQSESKRQEHHIFIQDMSMFWHTSD